MANRTTGFTAPGQRESIVRGERTDPRAILGQSAAWAACGSVLSVAVAAIVAICGYGWWVVDHWRVFGVALVAPWPIAALLALVALTVEIFDPNWPPPRKATGSTRPLWPHSGERERPSNPPSSVRLGDLYADLDEDDDE